MKRQGFSRGLLAILVAAAFSAPSWAWTADLGLGFSWRNTDATGFFPLAELKMGYDYQGFGVDLDLLALTDGLYPLPDPMFKFVYFKIKSGGLAWHSGALALRAGVTAQLDLTDSPYRLFFNSSANSVLGGSLKFDDGTFFYETRWSALNWNSGNFRQPYPVLDASGNPTSQSVNLPFDRGLNYRTIGLHLGEFRVAYQEASLYTGRVFDPLYFVVPLPSGLTQYIRNSSGAAWQEAKPWGQFGNDNFLFGLLVDYDSRPVYVVIQILIDDFNLNRFVNPAGAQNPNKIALQLGGRLDTDVGKFGLFAALATKYTFEPYGNSTDNTRYGYYYYPDVESGGKPIPLADNVLGFKNGENSLSFMLEYANTIHSVKLSTNIEFQITGEQSPANPWGAYLDWAESGPGDHFLDDTVLEKKLVLRAGAELPISVFTLNLTGALGYVWNELALVDAGGSTLAVNSLKIYRPSAQSRFIGSLEFSAVVHFDQVVAAIQALPAIEPAKAEPAAAPADGAAR